MENLAIALGMSSIMICLGMVIRSKVKFLKNLLVPVNVIAGILGALYMNFLNTSLIPDVGVDYSNYYCKCCGRIHDHGNLYVLRSKIRK